MGNRTLPRCSGAKDARNGSAAWRTGAVETSVGLIGKSPSTTPTFVVIPLKGSASPRRSASSDILRKRARASSGVCANTDGVESDAAIIRVRNSRRPIESWPLLRSNVHRANGRSLAVVLIRLYVHDV